MIIKMIIKMQPPNDSLTANHDIHAEASIMIHDILMITKQVFICCCLLVSLSVVLVKQIFT